MVQKLETLVETASQTAGPYVHIGLMPSYCGNAGAYQQEIGVSPIDDGATGVAQPTDATGVSEEAALNHVFGYSVMIDVSDGRFPCSVKKNIFHH